MNNLMEETLDDGSIVVVSKQSIDEDMETENSFMITPRFVPGMSESQQLSDSTHKQLQDILKENNELRDSLHKNNTEMRQLLGAFRDYQDKTLQSRALHKQKIDSIWKDSQQLLLDKQNISQENKDLQDQLKLKDLEIKKLEADMIQVQSMCSGLENELETVKENLKRSEVTVLTITNQVKEQESEVAALKLENEKLFNQNEALIEQLDRKNSLLEAAELGCATKESEIQVANTELETHKMQICNLLLKIESESNQKQALLENLETQNKVYKEDQSAALQQGIDLKNQLSLLKVRLTEYETSESNAKSKLESALRNISDLQAKLDEVEQEKIELLQFQELNRLSTPDADDMGFSLVNQPEIVAALGDATLQKKLEEEETRCKELHQVIAQQREQLETLERAVSMRSKEEPIHEAEVAERFFQIQKFSNVKTPSYIFQDYEDRYQSIGQQLGACEERLLHLKFEDSSTVLLEGLKQEVELLKQLLEQERLEKTMEKKNLEERIEQLTVEYRRVLATWETYESDQKTKGRQNEALNAIEKRQHQEQLDELIAKNVSLEEERQVKDSELARLKRQISMLNTETEQMPILRAQVEVYRQDFSKERDEKAKAETLANQLRQDISVFQAQVSELRDELSALHDHQRHELSFGHSGSYQLGQEGNVQSTAPVEDLVRTRGPFRSSDDRETSRKRRSHQTRRYSPPAFEERYASLSTENTFECPRCKMTYSTVNAVENHLEACLNESGPYP